MSDPSSLTQSVQQPAFPITAIKRRLQLNAHGQNFSKASNRGGFVWNFAILVVGITCGVLFATRSTWVQEFSRNPSAADKAAPSIFEGRASLDTRPDIAQLEEVASPKPVARLVVVTRIAEVEKPSSTGIILPDNSAMVIRLSALLNVRSIEFENISINSNDLVVAAIDALHDLALLKLGTASPVLETPTMSNPQDGKDLSKTSILLGNSYAVGTLTERVRIEINEKLKEFADGTSGYSVSGRGRMLSPLMPVFTPQFDILVGLAIPVTDSPFTLKLLDRDILKVLVADAHKLPASSLFLLQQDFFENTAIGLLRQFEAHEAAGHFSGMFEAGERYLATGALIRRADIIETLHSRIHQRLNAFYRLNNFQAAQALFDRSSFFLPRNSKIDLTYFQYQLTGSNAAAALDAARYWLEGDKGVDRPRWLKLHFDAVFSVLNTGTFSDESPQTLLTQAIATDPTQADYYLARAKQFELSQQYPRAVEDLNQAILLDPQLRNELNREIDRLQRRISSPAALRVPVRNIGGVLSAEVHINGIALNFIIDTGASRTAISSSTANFLGLADEASGEVPITTANGVTYGSNLTVDDLNVAGAVARNLNTVVVESLGAHDGLLGLDFLGKYQLEIDSAAGEIILTPH